MYENLFVPGDLMKNMLCLVALLFTVNLYSEPIGTANFLLDNGLRKNYSKIKRISTELNEQQKYELYEKYRKAAWYPLIINTLSIPGIGSAVQGDFISAVPEFVGYLTGFALFVDGNHQHKPKMLPFGNDTTGWKNAVNDYRRRCKVEPAIGLSIMGISLLTSMITPFAYSYRHNSRLGNALNLTGEKYSFRMTPDMINDYKEIGISLNINIGKRE